MRTTKGRIQLAALVVIVAAAAVFGWHAVRPRIDPQQTAGGPSAAGMTAFRRAWPAGETSIYRLEMRSKVFASEQAILDFVLRGAWELTLLSGDSKQSIHARLCAAEFESATASEADERLLAAWRKGFELPHFFTLGDSGAVTAVRLPPDMPGFVQGVIKSLIAGTQFAASASGESAWSAQEHDTTGRYEARYVALGNRRFTKQKARYLEILAAPAALTRAGVTTEVLSSRCEFGFRNDALLEELTCSEETRVAGAAPMPPMRSLTKLSLRLTGTRSAQDVMTRLRDEYAAAQEMLVHAPPTQPGVRLDTDLAKTAGLTLAQALDQLGRLSSDQEGQTQRAKTYSSVAALIRTDPAAADESLKRIRRGDPSSSALIDALGDAGSARGQELLTKLIEDPKLDGESRRRALISLSFSPSPTEQTTEFLTGLIDDASHGTQARFALGTAAHRLAESSPERAAAVLATLLGRLDSETEDGARIDDLTALGNAGHSGALSAIERYLVSPSPGVRAAALTALRRIPGVQADQHLARALREDPAGLVRLHAIRAMDQRASSDILVTAVAQSVRSEPEANVRSKAIGVAVRWAAGEATLREALAWAAQNDENANLRRVAQINLQRITGSG